MASCWKPSHSSFRHLLLLFVVFVLTVEGAGAEASNSSVRVLQKDGEFDKRYVDTVTSEEQIIYTFNHTVTRNKVSSRQRLKPRQTRDHSCHCVSMAHFGDVLFSCTS